MLGQIADLRLCDFMSLLCLYPCVLRPKLALFGRRSYVVSRIGNGTVCFQ